MRRYLLGVGTLARSASVARRADAVSAPGFLEIGGQKPDIGGFVDVQGTGTPPICALVRWFSLYGFAGGGLTFTFGAD